MSPVIGLIVIAVLIGVFIGSWLDLGSDKGMKEMEYLPLN